MKALILAGGQGQRLRPYTTVVPKPLMPLGDKPVLEVLLRQLHAHGIREVVIAVNHLRELIEAFFNDGRALGLKITYSVEDEPLGTAGPIGAVLDELGNDFLVLNGDLLTTLDFARLITAHETSRAAATVAIYRQQLRLDYGIITRDGDNRLTDYVEKPMHHYEVSMGCYVLRAAEVRPHCQPNVRLDMPDLLRRLIAVGSSVRCFDEPCFWLDIGRPEDHRHANEIVAQDPGRFLYFEKP